MVPVAHSYIVKPVLSGHLIIDKTKILMKNNSLMKVGSIAEFGNTFELHSAIIGLENQILVFFLSVLLYLNSHVFEAQKIHYKICVTYCHQ